MRDDEHDLKGHVLNELLAHVGKGWAGELKAKYKPERPAEPEAVPDGAVADAEEVDLTDLSVLGDLAGE